METMTGLLMAAMIEMLSCICVSLVGFWLPRRRKLRNAQISAVGKVTGYRRGNWHHNVQKYLYFPIVSFSVNGRRYKATWSDDNAIRDCAGEGDEEEILTIYEDAPQIDDDVEVVYNPDAPWENRISADMLRYEKIASLSIAGIGCAVAGITVIGFRVLGV